MSNPLLVVDAFHGVRDGKAGDRSLQTTRRRLTDPQQMEGVVKLLCESDAWGGLLARLGHQLSHFKDKELASVLTTVNRQMRFFDTPSVAQSTKTSSFDPAELRQGRMTVYLVLPPDHMRAQSGLLRLWVDSMMRAVVRGGLQEQNKVHFILDEAASLGHMESIDDAVDKFRGYGIRLLFLYQSLGQLKKCFPEGQDQTLLSNCTQVYFGINDYQTAEYVSNRLGEKTIVVASGGTSTGTTRQTSDEGGKGSSSYSQTENDNWSQTGRKLLKPEEILALHERTAITFAQGMRPIWTNLVRYYEESLLDAPPSLWGKFKAAAGALAASLLVLAAASLMVFVVDMATRKPWH